MPLPLSHLVGACPSSAKNDHRRPAATDEFKHQLGARPLLPSSLHIWASIVNRRGPPRAWRLAPRTRPAVVLVVEPMDSVSYPIHRFGVGHDRYRSSSSETDDMVLWALHRPPLPSARAVRIRSGSVLRRAVPVRDRRPLSGSRRCTCRACCGAASSRCADAARAPPTTTKTTSEVGHGALTSAPRLPHAPASTLGPCPLTPRTCPPLPPPPAGPADGSGSPPRSA